jgi:hypothetical protein
MTKVWASGADAVVSDRCDLAKKSLITFVQLVLFCLERMRLTTDTINPQRWQRKGHQGKDPCRAG